MAQMAKRKEEYLYRIYSEIYLTTRKNALDNEIDWLNAYGTKFSFRTFYREFAPDFDKEQLAKLDSLMLEYGTGEDNLDYFCRVIEPKERKNGKLEIENFDAVKPHYKAIIKSKDIKSITLLSTMPYTNVFRLESLPLESLKFGFGYGLSYLKYVAHYLKEYQTVHKLCEQAASNVKRSKTLTDMQKDNLLAQIKNILETRRDIDEMRGRLPEETRKYREQQYQNFINQYPNCAEQLENDMLGGENEEN